MVEYYPTRTICGKQRKATVTVQRAAACCLAPGREKSALGTSHPSLDRITVAPRLGNFFAPFFRRRDGKSPLATGADDGGASPAHVLAPPHPPMMRAHPPALPLSIRAVP